MLNIIFTLDYEIHGNGDGCSYELMVEPTARMLDLFDKYGARLTIMADVAEIIKFREYRDRFGRDDYHYEAIVAQLQEAIRRGHDVQLHLHCSYFNARHENGKWQQDWSEYNFAALSEHRLNEVLATGKNFLEANLRSIDPNYRCRAFRAANWAVSPSQNVVRALINNGFEIDTSVFKYGRRTGLVSFDYSKAPSELVPWLVDETDICRQSSNGNLLEIPIYSEQKWLGAFFSRNRIHRVRMSRNHQLNVLQDDAPRSSKMVSRLTTLFRKHAWKADFNQCTGRQLVRALKRAEANHAGHKTELPFVLIGHSKLFSRANQRSLEPFLSYVCGHRTRARFATLSDFACRHGRPGRENVNRAHASSFVVTAG